VVVVLHAVLLHTSLIPSVSFSLVWDQSAINVLAILSTGALSCVFCKLVPYKVPHVSCFVPTLQDAERHAQVSAKPTVEGNLQGWLASAWDDNQLVLFLQGLDDLGKRAAKYYEAGARFAKWRAVLQISATAPSLLVPSPPP